MSTLIDLLVQVIVNVSTRAWLIFMMLVVLMSITIIVVTLT